MLSRYRKRAGKWPPGTTTARVLVLEAPVDDVGDGFKPEVPVPWREPQKGKAALGMGSGAYSDGMKPKASGET